MIELQLLMVLALQSFQPFASPGLLEFISYELWLGRYQGLRHFLVKNPKVDFSQILGQLFSMVRQQLLVLLSLSDPGVDNLDEPVFLLLLLVDKRLRLVLNALVSRHRRRAVRASVFIFRGQTNF